MISPSSLSSSVSTSAAPFDSASHVDSASVLIVEDEQLIALDLKRRVEGLGHQVVHTVRTGEEALEVAKRISLCLVLLDVHLAGELDGIQVAEILNRETDTAIVFVSGNSDDPTLARALAAHPFSYIVKPIRERELKMCISMALYHHRMRRALRNAQARLEERVAERTAELAATNNRLQFQIAEHIKMEIELRHARILAESAARSRTRFFANISHDIRTPMNGIVGMADLLSHTSLTTEQENYLSTMKHCASTLLATIDELLEFSELEVGQVQLAPIGVDLRELLPSVLKPLHDRARAQNVDLLCDMAPELPARVYADPVRLGQVLVNLIGFALKCTDSGEVEVQCEMLAESGGRAYIHLSIRDGSSGLPADRLRQVQQMLNETNAATRDLEQVDLGLAIATMLVQLMDGVLWLDAIPGMGNVFHCALWLPTTASAANPAVRVG